MGRQSLPEPYGPGGTEVRRSVRGRAIAVSTALVLAIGAGTVVAAQSGLLSFGESCGDEELRLGVAASPDIAPAVEAAADRARRAELQTDGRCLNVRVTARPAAEVAEELRRGGGRSDYQVWIPDSGVWTERVTASSGSAGVDDIVHLATSPVGLAATPEAAGLLGWPDRTYDWAELAEAALGEQSGLRAGGADPAASATGTLALTAIQRAAGPGGEAGPRAAATAKVLSQRVVPGDREVLSTLPDSGFDDPKDNQALILSEQAAYAHNEQAVEARRLDMFYPEGATVLLDYPYTIVDNDTMPMDLVRAANRFQSLLTDDTGVRTLRQHGFRTGKGRADRDLVQAAGGSSPQPYDAAPADPPTAEELGQALGMWTITVQSSRLTAVVDVSGSMADPVPGLPGQTRMDVTKTALAQALAQFGDEDEIGLWRFSARLDGAKDYEEMEPTVRLAERGGGGTAHRDRLAAAAGSLRPIEGGATGLYDTALAVYRKQVESYDPGRFNSVALLTDGANEDPDSISREQLVRELREAADPERPVGLIVIAIGPDADLKSCEQIARATGSTSYQVVDPRDIHRVLLQAVTDAGSQAALS